MMFDKEGKDNTQKGVAKSLCESCRFRNPNTVNDYCRLDREFRKAVGICKDYQEYKSNDYKTNYCPDCGAAMEKGGAE